MPISEYALISNVSFIMDEHGILSTSTHAFKRSLQEHGYVAAGYMVRLLYTVATLVRALISC